MSFTEVGYKNAAGKKVPQPPTPLWVQMMCGVGLVHGIG